MTDNETIIKLAQLFRFTFPFLLALILILLFKDSNKQLNAFSSYSPLKTRAYLYGINNTATFLLQYDNIIGRSQAECDICIPDRAVSRVHARISYRNGTWEIFDLDSKYGTMLDNKPIKYSALKDGALIQLGTGTYTFLTHMR